VRFDSGGANRVVMRLESLRRGRYAPESRGVIFECRRVEGSGLVCVSRPWVRGASAPRTCERILEWVFLQSARGLFEEIVKARHGGMVNKMILHRFTQCPWPPLFPRAGKPPLYFLPTVSMLGQLFLTIAILALFHCKDNRQISCLTRHLTTISHSGFLNL
jgi:hypothetical protein